MSRVDKTKDEGIIGDRKGNEHIAENCCADGSCCWNDPTDKRSGEEEEQIIIPPQGRSRDPPNSL